MLRLSLFSTLTLSITAALSPVGFGQATAGQRNNDNGGDAARSEASARPPASSQVRGRQRPVSLLDVTRRAPLDEQEQTFTSNSLVPYNGAIHINPGGSLSAGAGGLSNFIESIPFGTTRASYVHPDGPAKGIERMLFYVPDIPAGQTAPLLVAFHQFAGSEFDVPLNSTFLEEAVARGWYLAMPLGRHDQVVEDVTFASPSSQRAIEFGLEWLVDNFEVDDQRIYGVGFSMGGGVALSYGARHLDLARPMFAAIANHTGSVSVKNVYESEPDDLCEPPTCSICNPGEICAYDVPDYLDYVFLGDPGSLPFEYAQASVIDISLGGSVDPASDMARNLQHVPVRNSYHQGDPVTYLVTQTQVFHSHFVNSVGGTAVLDIAAGAPAQHLWRWIKEDEACDFLEQFTLQVPTSGRLLVDRDARWLHFDVEQLAPGAFSPITFDIDSLGNQLTLESVSNVSRVGFDPAAGGLDRVTTLTFHVQADDQNSFDLVLDDIPFAPQEVSFDAVPLGLVATGQPGGYWYDPALRRLTLPAVAATWGATPHDWVVVPTLVDSVVSSVVATPVTGLIADGVDASTITITVVDQFGAPIEGASVAVTPNSGPDTVVVNGSTDVNGIVTASLSTTFASTKTVQVVVDPGGVDILLGDMPQVTFIGDAGNISSSLSTVVATPDSSVIADGVTTSTIEVVVRDGFQNPVAGIEVELAAQGSSNTLTQPVGVTDAAGRAVGYLASTVAEVKTIDATIDPGGLALPVDTPELIDFTGDPGNISTVLSTVVADPITNLVADGIQESTITVLVLDANANPVRDVEIDVFVTGSANSVAGDSQTDSVGQAAQTLSSTVAEVKTITVTLDPSVLSIVLPMTPTVEFEGDASNLSSTLTTVVAVPASGVVADGITTSQVDIVARDVNGNPVGGVESSVSVTGIANVLVQPGLTDSSGLASATLASTHAESKIVSIILDPNGSPVPVAAVATIEFTGDPATIDPMLSTVSADPPFGVLADGSSRVDVLISVRDIHDNPVEGRTVEVSSTGLGNSIFQPLGPTGADGLAIAWIVSDTAERKLISATIDPLLSNIGLAVPAETEFVWPLGDTFFVRTSGSDLALGDSPDTAWATISHAATRVHPGDTVWVGAGVYSESVELTEPGTLSNPIRFIADTTGAHTGDAGLVIVDAGGVPAAMQLNGCDYTSLVGFHVTGASPGGGPGGGVQVGPNSTLRPVLRSLHAYGNQRGIHVVSAPSIVIEDCRISNNSGAGGVGIRLVNTAGASLKANLIYANDGSGVEILTASTATLQANTLFQNQNDQVTVALNSTVTLKNNVIALGLQNGIVDAGGNVTSNYNLVWGHFGADYVNLAPGANDISLAPGFTDPDGSDNQLGGIGGLDDEFFLASGSPAIDAGATDAENIVLSNDTSLADMTTRADGGLDGTEDLPTLNVGYHYPAVVDPLPAALANGARLGIGNLDARQPSFRSFDGSSFDGPFRAPPTGKNVRILDWQRSPLADEVEYLLTVSHAVTTSPDGSAKFVMLENHGGEWVQAWSDVGAMTQAEVARQPVAFSVGEVTGTALFVCAVEGDKTPWYRIRTSGVWSGLLEMPLNDNAGPNPDPNNGEVRWLEVAVRPGSEEVGLTYVDANDDLVGIIWDGSQWLTSTAQILDTILAVDSVTGEVENRAFDCVGTASGAPPGAGGRAGGAGAFSARYAGGSWLPGGPVTGATSTQAPQYVELAQEPGTDRIAAAFQALEGTEEVGLALWDGSSWGDISVIDTQARDANGLAAGDRPGALAWDGANAVFAYADDLPSTIGTAVWTLGSGWAVDVPLLVPSLAVESLSLQQSDGDLLGLYLDDMSELYAISRQGGTWSVLNGTPVATQLSSAAGAPFTLLR